MYLYCSRDEIDNLVPFFLLNITLRLRKQVSALKQLANGLWVALVATRPNPLKYLYSIALEDDGAPSVRIPLLLREAGLQSIHPIDSS